MKLKTFQTHTLSGSTDLLRTIELSFNVWASENKDVKIERTEYLVAQRVNGNGTAYEEVVLFVFYS